MQRLLPQQQHTLFDTAATRRIEQRAQAALPPNTLMQRAGLAVARLSLALAPHARTVWLACGPGNNGGDGLEAAAQLKRLGKRAVVTWLGSETTAPADARTALQRARDAGVTFSDAPPDDLTVHDLCVDALLGIGPARPPEGRMAELMRSLGTVNAPILSVDLPSGLDADTGQFATSSIANDPNRTRTIGYFHSKSTLTLLTVKPGLFTGHGRDASGQVWFDDLGVDPGDEPPTAWLQGEPATRAWQHASHKGTHGDVAVIGGEGLAARGMGMGGAALLAASAALHGGAGRVLLCPLDPAMTATPIQPELMLRRFDALDLDALTVVCGCGGGDAVRSVLPAVLSRAARLVLDADALNAVAADPQLQTLLRHRAARGLATVLTPHPLEAARLLASTTADVQAHRLTAAQQLADAMGCTVVLKGSGTVTAAHGAVPRVNPTGNGRLGVAGTGDVLAGFVGARWAQGLTAMEAAAGAVWLHGAAADAWPAQETLTAGALAARLSG
jgi:ADP-dependent NAD(P)H-hydrate dehydratase / NAD(P)H-hydrate epimerase